MKIAKGIASVLKTIGLVVMAIAIVMSIYVVANDGAGWSTLSGAAALLSAERFRGYARLVRQAVFLRHD